MPHAFQIKPNQPIRKNIPKWDILNVPFRHFFRLLFISSYCLAYSFYTVVFLR